MTQNPTDILKHIYGYDSFRGQQEAVIDHVMAGQNAFVLMPTGSGKSLCYQIPAICLEGVGIVVSPLVALMQDQVSALTQLGIRVAAIHSNLDFESISQARQALLNNQLDLLYVAPERLLMEEFLQLLNQVKIALFAIDEAHCVSQWGHDFRPHYTQLSALNELFPNVPRLALTATADAPTRKDIVEKLHLQKGKSFVDGFDRPNIHYTILPKYRPKEQLLDFIQREYPKDSGIIYCGTRKLVDETVTWFRGHGVKALPYHAGLTRQNRTENQKTFLHEENVVMVATIAFGMGIDKPDVRFVAHLSTPKNIEAYYQETGRAGRDGLPANALMLYGINDVAQQRSLIDSSTAPEQQKRIEHQKLTSLLTLCEAACCRRQVLLTYFGDDSQPCQNCDNCDKPPETFDGTIPAQKAMSCVYRTGQRFGIAYLIDVLLGKDDERIKRFRHNLISTYGIGQDYDKFQWQNVFRQLISLNLLMVDIAAHGGVKLTLKGRQILKDRSPIMLRLDDKPRKEQKARFTKQPLTFANEEDEALFQAMRKRRTEMAKSLQLPPYVILADKTLHELASKRPVSKEELQAIRGFGDVKIEKYGRVFLEIIASHDGISQEGDEAGAMLAM